VGRYEIVTTASNPHRNFSTHLTAALIVAATAMTSASMSLAQDSAADSLLFQQAAPEKSAAVGPIASDVVARVAGTPIYRGDVDKVVNNLIRGRKVDQVTVATAQARVLDELIKRNLIRNFLADQKINISKEEINTVVENLRTKLKQQSSSLEDFLARTNETDSSLRTKIAQELGWNKYVAANRSDEALQAFFKQFHEQYDGTQRRASHILLRPQSANDPSSNKALFDQAKQLREDITSGKTTFEAAAERFSAGPSRARGGDIGFFPLHGVMQETFSQAAFSIKPGEISDPVPSDFGVHLIKVTEIKPGTKSLSDVREAVQGGFSVFLLDKVTKDQRQAKADQITIDPNFPHFKPGTTELESAPTAPPVGSGK
jgi:parvulin-like peptidyl-prolyl isomerase